MNTTMGSATLYDRLGGEQALLRLVERYLFLLRTRAEYAPLCAHYTRGFEHYKKRMFEYLSGFLGGPGLYMQRHGMPSLRENHPRIAITPQLRDLWYGCMAQAVNDEFSDIALRRELESAFWTIADSLRNA